MLVVVHDTLSCYTNSNFQMEPRFSSVAMALEGVTFLSQALASILVITLNSILFNPIKMVTSQCKKIVIFSINRVIIFYIKGNLEAVVNIFHAVQLQTLLSSGIWGQKLLKLIPIIAKNFPLPSVELLVTLAWTPLVALDVVIQVCQKYI